MTWGKELLCRFVVQQQNQNTHNKMLRSPLCQQAVGTVHIISLPLHHWVFWPFTLYTLHKGTPPKDDQPSACILCQTAPNHLGPAWVLSQIHRLLFSHRPPPRVLPWNYDVHSLQWSGPEHQVWPEVGGGNLSWKNELSADVRQHPPVTGSA